MRLIDADALIKFIDNRYDITWKDDYEGGIKDACTDILEEINNMPTIEPEPHWIKCSERLPEYGVSVLTYDGYCYCVEKRIPNIRDEEGEPITGDWWVSDDYDEYDSDYYPNLRDGACIAWMYLPEPHKEGQE